MNIVSLFIKSKKENENDEAWRTKRNYLEVDSDESLRFQVKRKKCHLEMQSIEV